MPFRNLSDAYEADQLTKMTSAYETAHPQITAGETPARALAYVIIDLFHQHPDADADRLARMALERFRFDPGGNR